MNDYVEVRRINYDGAVFVPVCDKCHRFVKADEDIKVNGLFELFKYKDELSPEPNCTCSRCGRAHMIFEGWF